MIIKIVQWHEIIDSIEIHFPLRVQKNELMVDGWCTICMLKWAWSPLIIFHNATLHFMCFACVGVYFRAGFYGIGIII